ncbi:MAG: 16S rRNA (cytidine(1402)-2'-O)-methyltransferase, partial [Erysipelotrichaceae bacterium]|nr:16S rRNA (cytidine(1402)-2'-O)-methyltransferase [Erysipelotrichaceae bacterium]
ALKDFPYTLIFYEAPHRIEKTLKLALKVLGDRRACLARELTKLHEEYHRDTLSKLCELHDLKGEMVLIIEGQNEEKEVSLEDLLKEVKEGIKAGMRSKEAISTVAKKYDVSKNSLYEEYLKQKEDKQDEGE